MYEVAIGGATPSWFDCGATYYAQIVEEIKQMCEVPISVELIPPDDRFIDLLCDAGADALVMSLEVFNESVRKRVCPGKSQVGRERYFGAWKRALALLGEGNVSSVLLAGLEDPMETIAGSEEMIRLGVLPHPNSFC
jgi:biotin synthase-related radical SAM superfamily protein